MLKDKDNVRLLLAWHAKVNLADENGVTPLHLAVIEDRSGVVQLFLENQANVDATTSGNGWYIINGCEIKGPGDDSPLHFAAAAGRGEAVRLLIRHGADPEKHNAAGETPLDMAMRHGRTGMANVLNAERE